MRHCACLCGIMFAVLIIGCGEPTSPPRTSAPATTANPPPTIVPEVAAQVPSPEPVAKPVEKTTETENPLTPEEPVEAVIAEPEAETPFTLEDGFSALTLDDFESFGAESDTWSAADDTIVCTGKPKGYLYSKMPYQNFTWKLEYRFERPKSLKDESKFKGNTGFLVYINGEHKQWPVCLEVQGKHVQMAAIKENGGASPVTVHDDEAARATARKPVGQWNRLEIVSKDGALTVKLNDELISRSEPNFLSEGKIGIQAEDHPFIVRRMRIRAE